ncbi:MAG: TrmH family RNA methyltransferase [Candidatus Dojkabacteria bacterium]|nr:TrmH family RNA methyltransferase [Candidatus Dojkabacteria bacterium]
MKLKAYRKKLEFSYSIGVYPTIELIKHRFNDVLSVLVRSDAKTNAGAREIIDTLSLHHMKYSISDKAIRRITPKENIYAVGLFRKYETPLDPALNHVVLVNPSSHGNVGTIIRTMLGFGLQDLAVISPAADSFHPEVIRASMGARFQVRCQNFDGFQEYSHAFPRAYYFFAKEAETSIDTVSFDTPFSLVFGNEGRGLNKQQTDDSALVRIPQKAGIDSFNLAISAGIAMYEATKKTVT